MLRRHGLGDRGMYGVGFEGFVTLNRHAFDSADVRAEEARKRREAARKAEQHGLVEQPTRAFDEGTVGRTYPVLRERTGHRPGQMVGRSPYIQSVHVAAGATRAGEFVSVEIIRRHPNSLAGRIVGAAAAAACGWTPPRDAARRRRLSRLSEGGQRNPGRARGRNRLEAAAVSNGNRPRDC